MSDSPSSTPATSHGEPQTAAPHDTHAEDHSHIEAHLRMYWITGGILLLATVLTVALSYMDFDKWFNSHGWNMRIGVLVATCKVCIVGAIFMHLKEERATIWRFLYFTMFFAAGLVLLILLAWVDPIPGTFHSSH